MVHSNVRDRVRQAHAARLRRCFRRVVMGLLRPEFRLGSNNVSVQSIGRSVEPRERVNEEPCRGSGAK